MSEIEKFKNEVRENIQSLGQDTDLQELSRHWALKASAHKYTYNFRWLGRPIIQHPQDILAMQELIWEVKPDLIIETGIAHGGSIIFYASMLELLAQCGHGDGLVLGIDIDIRQHNREAIEAHPMHRRIQMLQGSSIDPALVEQVRQIAASKRTVMVVLDSNHTHDHVLAELNAYAPLTSVDSYCVVFDTFVEDTPKSAFPDRPWGPGNNPKTAVHAYLRAHPEFAVDKAIEHKLLITSSPDGFLKRVS
ncbi:cephalosporin hydroxylase family protein [Ralstonia soli]|uniref:Cephalosporin hydroxylase family protein n=1 Tax=Ralstonia soli TaxID=2953896 RepID=A0ABT1AP99_9RALS|nr:cephalosporin hydroxylase family protein [Ralstonia soli]MCO5400266.1 cephalosporin hydroxylase family protein [Ralstonia soli]